MEDCNHSLDVAHISYKEESWPTAGFFSSSKGRATHIILQLFLLKDCLCFCPCFLIDTLWRIFNSFFIWQLLLITKVFLSPDQNICLYPVILHSIKYLLYLFVTALWCHVLNVIEMTDCERSAQKSKCIMFF